MKRCFTICAALLVLGLSLGQRAQAQDVLVSQSVRHDTSPPMRDILRNMAPVTLTQAPYAVPNKFVAFGGRFGRTGQAPDTVDPLRQTANGPLAPSVGINVEGLSDDDNQATIGYRVAPPDANGDVGVDYFVQYINSIWAVYRKRDGVRVSGPNPGKSFWFGFGGPCEVNNDGDPIVLYDHLAGRWMFSQFSVGEGTQCVAVSTTSDPLGPYHRYAFVVTPGGQNDYPKLGLWTDGAGQSAYTFTLRDFGGAGGSFSVSAGVMERDAMLAGNPAQFVKFINPCTAADCIEGQLPPHLEGPPPPAGTCPTFFTYYDASYDDGPSVNDGVRNHTLCVDWNNTANSTYGENAFILGTGFDRFLGNGFSDCIGPVQGGEVLDCLAAFTMYRAQYRWRGTFASVVLNTTVDVGLDQGGVRWGEVRSNNGQTGWGFHQEGTFAPDTDERWMGSIAMNGNGDIALGYSVAGPTLFPAVRATGQTADQSGSGLMNVGEFSIYQGNGAQTASGNRWGDYSSMSVDPVDDETFWFTTEYYENSGSFDFKTRISSFTLGPPPVATDVHVQSIVTEVVSVGKGSKKGRATVEIRNDLGGLVSGATVQGTFGGSISETVSGTTDGSGVAILETTGTAKGGVTISFCVNNVVDNGGSLPYDPSDNPDPSYACSAPTSVHVENVSTGTQGAGGGNKRGTATVTLNTNLDGNPGAGYTVSGTFGGDFGESASGTTGSGGTVTFTTTNTARGKVNVTFCVSNVTPPPPPGGLPYIVSDNTPGTNCGASKSALAGEVPGDYALEPNYPNPFNPTTLIAYSLAEAGPVTLKVYNVLGQQVATLVDGYKASGRHEVVFDATKLSAGVYLYVIQAEGFTKTQRMTLLK